MNEKQINEFFGDDAPSNFGSGWWSGVLSVFFGALGLGGVLCLHFPQLLTTPEMRVHYPVDLIRALIQGLIVAAFVAGVISSILREKKALGITGMLLAFAAVALGGAGVPINGSLSNGPAIGLDWFLLDLLATALFFVPLERIWPQFPGQSTFRSEWALDIVYWASTHLPIQIMSFLILLPATQATHYLAIPGIAHQIAALPIVVQFVLAVFVADLCEWAIHFALHKVPFLWRFHSIHHSSRALDWIAGSRAHFVDDLLLRGLILVPMMLAFSQTIIMAYLVFVTLHATWAHCNFRPTVKWLEPYLVMPRFHHWHHSSQKEAIDKNFAIHFPWIDKFFGTYFYPKEWPERYGLDDEIIPQGFIRQTYVPFLRPNARA